MNNQISKHLNNYITKGTVLIQKNEETNPIRDEDLSKLLNTSLFHFIQIKI